MRPRRIAPLLAVAPVLAALLAVPVVSAAAPPPVDPQGLTATLRNAQGAEVGSVEIVGGRLLVRARGLTPGFHGMHLHETGSCDPAGAFASAGGHLGDEAASHGVHLGDLPALVAQADGTAVLDAELPLPTFAQLMDADGSALVVHGDRDNYANISSRYRYGGFTTAESGPDATTLAGGDSGPRVACGVLDDTGLVDRTLVPPGRSAIATLLGPDGAARGTVTFDELRGQVRVTTSATGLPAGFHGMHVHAVGSCDPTDGFTSAGGHLNPRSTDHGAHAGDLPPLRVGADGTAVAITDTDTFSLDDVFDADGAAVVVHAAADNLGHIPSRYRHDPYGTGNAGPDALTRSTGDSGGRIRCGEIRNTAATFFPLTPRRVLDTRYAGTQNGGGVIRGDATRRLAVAGRFGVPDNGVTAVALTLTGIAPTAETHLMVSPASATPQRTTSVLNLRRGQTAATTVVVPLGGGAVDIYNRAGAVHAAVDIAGYYTVAVPVPGGASRFTGVAPHRLSHAARGANQVNIKTLGPEQSTDVAVTGVGGVPADGVSAVTLTVTTTRPTATSHLTAWPTGADRPTTSISNWVRGQTRATTVTVPVGRDGQVSFYNDNGSVDLLVDVAGYYRSSGTGGRYVAVTPYRIPNAASGTGDPAFLTVGPDAFVDVQLTRTARPGAGPGDVSAVPYGARVVALTVTASRTTARSHLTVHATGTDRPGTSNLNWAPEETVATTVFAPVNADGVVRLYNRSGSVTLLVDVLGFVTG